MSLFPSDISASDILGIPGKVKDEVVGPIENSLNTVKSDLTNTVNAAFNGINSRLNEAENAASGLLSSVNSAVVQPVVSDASGVLDFTQKLFGQIQSAANGLSGQGLRYIHADDATIAQIAQFANDIRSANGLIHRIDVAIAKTTGLDPARFQSFNTLSHAIDILTGGVDKNGAKVPLQFVAGAIGFIYGNFPLSVWLQRLESEVVNLENLAGKLLDILTKKPDSDPSTVQRVVAEIKIAIWMIRLILDALSKLVRYLIKALPADISVGGFGDAVVAGVNAELKLSSIAGAVLDPVASTLEFVSGKLNEFPIDSVPELFT